jgi:gamma-glutamyltranspeptidase
LWHHLDHSLELLNQFLNVFLFSVQGMKNGVVASDHSVCSTVGKNIMMKNGGNAVDAAVATALCLGVANPASSGIGGGMFMVLYADQDHHEKRWQSLSESKRPTFVDAREHPINKQSTFSNSYGKNKKMIEVIDAREVAPEMATVDMYLNPNIPPMASTRGGLAIAVLGELRGLELAHARHGSLDWATVVEPAFRLARDGVIVTKTLATDISYQQTAINRFNLTDLQTLLSRHPNQTDLLQEGDTLRNPTLARTLEAIMKEGADAIYRGFRAKNLAKEIQDAGGIITERDLERYQATLRSPLISEASGFTFVSVPPPSSGGATIMGILRFLSGFSSPLASLADTLSVHRLVEAMRHAFAIRMSLSDPGVPSSNTTQDATHDLIDGAYMDHLIRTSYQDQQAQDLSSYGGPKWAQLKDGEGQVKVPTDAHEGDRKRKLNRNNRELYREFGYLEDSGTTHVSIVDSMGNAVSLTSSINTYFGSGIVSKSTGIVLNNQMDGMCHIL